MLQHPSISTQKAQIGERRLELRLGELTLITGPNGSGKTTLSKLMCGILRPKQGRISIFGRRADELSLGEIGSYYFQFIPKRKCNCS